MTRFIKVVVWSVAFAMVASACTGGDGSSTVDGGSGGGLSCSTSTVSFQVPRGSERQPYTPLHQQPGPNVDSVIFSQAGVDEAVAEMKNGKLDFYQFSLRIAAANDLDKTGDTQVFRAPSGSVSIFMNPAPAREGEFNPLSKKEIRQAVSQLIDRPFIASDIYGGAAVPQYTFVSQVDHDWLTVAKTVAEAETRVGIKCDLAAAKSKIKRVMEAQEGVELIDGVWNYEGAPIVLKFIIRIEDERRDIGDALRTNLEYVGFQVQSLYQRFDAAVRLVYTSDPQAFGWHLYTEGWGRSSAERYDSSAVNQYTAPWMGKMPGARIRNYWNYENDRLDENGKKIFRGEFISEEDRNILYRESTAISLEDPIRIWVVTKYATYPAVRELTGMTEDVAAGPKSQLALREAYVPGRDTLRVGHLFVHTAQSTWNPVGGFGDVYSVDIWKNVVDPLVINDPSSGVPIPFRAEFTIETAGPTGKLAVPEDAVMWDALEDRWVNVDPKTQATSKVVFDLSKYFSSVWHHEQPITMADALYGVRSEFERANDEDKKKIEFVLAAKSRPVLDVFRGFRILDENRIEVYLDYWHFEEAYIASYAELAGLATGLAMPWEILAASDELVYERREAAYSQASAAKSNLPWLSFAQKSDASLVRKVLRVWSRQGTIPENIFTVNGVSYLTAEEAEARYQATLDFFEKYDHVVISQGPFMLTAYDALKQFAEIRAFRHETYPFKPGKWYRPRVEEVRFAQTNVSDDATVTSVTLEGDGTLELDYLLVDPSSGSVLASGKAMPGQGGEFAITLDPNVLEPHSGRYLDLVLLASSDATALISQEVVQIQP